jgi:hypothetical protein
VICGFSFEELGQGTSTPFQDVDVSKKNKGQHRMSATEAALPTRYYRSGITEAVSPKRQYRSGITEAATYRR